MGQGAAPPGSPLQLIDAEISVLREAQSHEQSVFKKNEIPDRLREVAEKLFVEGGVTDPEREKTKFRDISQFAMESGVQSPQELLALINNFDRDTRERWPSYSTLDRVWMSCHQAMAQRSLSEMARGP